MNINLAQLKIAGESNTGTIRHHNEDNFLIYAPGGGSAVLAAVADGIGGHSRGEVASYICCKEMFNAAMKRDLSLWDADFLKKVLEHANAKIFDFNFKGKRSRPMGCTVAAVLFFREKVIIASAGDSRVYEYDHRRKDKAFRQLTTDHRPEGYEKLCFSGRFRYTSFVSRSLGTAKHLEADIIEIPRNAGCRYVICSDGLYSRQPDQHLAGIIGSDISPRQAASKMVRGALLAGERDNVTVICAADAAEE